MSKNLLDILNKNKDERKDEVNELKEKIRSEYPKQPIISKEPEIVSEIKGEEKITTVYCEKEKITTKDCVEQIIKKYPEFGKDWKRSAKYRTDPLKILIRKKIN
jgi:hypothetical protein